MTSTCFRPVKAAQEKSGKQSRKANTPISNLQTKRPRASAATMLADEADISEKMLEYMLE